MFLNEENLELNPQMLNIYYIYWIVSDINKHKNQEKLVRKLETTV